MELLGRKKKRAAGKRNAAAQDSPPPCRLLPVLEEIHFQGRGARRPGSYQLKFSKESAGLISPA
eukprot:747784-Hanusia_phi.AAC.2